MIELACCPHGDDPATCSHCPSVCMTPHEFFTLFNCVWALGYAISPASMPVERDVVKKCHDEMAEIVLRRADQFTDFYKAHQRHS